VETLINDIKEKIKARGTLGIRGLARMFKILDNNGNRQIDLEEFYWGIKELGIGLSEAEASSVLAAFDRDGSGTVNFDEFLRALRGELSDSRLLWIKRAYDKLDVNCDGTVKLDDIARLYDVSRNPDVASGRKDPK
jgi:Ca2+-binding EF-hand superfamily protein